MRSMNHQNGSSWRAILMMLFLILTACGGEQGNPSEAASANGSSGEKPVARQFISIGSAPMGGVFFAMGAAIADVLNQSMDQNWVATAEATGGTMENTRRLDRGEMQLGMSSSAVAYFAARGEGGWEKAYPIQSVITLFPNKGQFVVRDDSDIHSIAGLKGKRVACGSEGGGMDYFLRPLLAAYGVAFEDFQQVYAGQQACAEYLGDGVIDAAFFAGGEPLPALASAAMNLDVRLVPYDEAVVKQLCAQYPIYRPSIIPGNTYRGQTGAFPTLEVGWAQLICAAGADDDFIYRVTKILYENRELLAQKHAAAKAITPETAPLYVGVDFHPGAIRYYREIGIWPDE